MDKTEVKSDRDSLLTWLEDPWSVVSVVRIIGARRTVIDSVETGAGDELEESEKHLESQPADGARSTGSCLSP